MFPIEHAIVQYDWLATPEEAKVIRKETQQLVTKKRRQRHGMPIEKETYSELMLIFLFSQPFSITCEATKYGYAHFFYPKDFFNHSDLIVFNINRQIHSKKPLLVLNRSKQNSGFLFYPITNDSTVFCTAESPCPLPNFVKEMSPDLFRRIQGAVPFKESDESYLILFKIKDRLKYCLTAESEVWHNFDFEFN